MLTLNRAMKLIVRLLALIGILATVQCGQSSTPTAPGWTVTVALSATSVAAGTTTQGIVTLGTPASSATTVTLASSNTNVATVPSSVSIATGTSTGTFAVTAVAPGTATITAAVNGASAQSSLTVTAQSAAALASLTVDQTTLVEGDSGSGTVTLTAAAPSSGAVVTLAATGPIIIAASVAVPAGSTSAKFTFTTKTGTGVTSGSITATYGGASVAATVTVNRSAVAIARFGVTGPNETDTCEMGNNGNMLNCTFNGSTSSAPGTIVSYEWTYSVVGGGSFSQTTTGATLTNPAINCSLMPSPPLPPGNSSFPLTVTLRIHDDRGNVADASNNGGARLLPMHTCGF
jgi:hypothetical protein